MTGTSALRYFANAVSQRLSGLIVVGTTRFGW